MDDTMVRRATGAGGMMTAAGTMVAVPLYCLYPGVPPAWNVLTRDLVAIATILAMLVFLSGLRHLVRAAAPEVDWASTLAYGGGLVYAAVVLVGASLEGGNVIGQPGQAVDATTTGPLAWVPS
jgi:hypothetical protein